MGIDNFKWDDQDRSVSWLYNGKHITKKYDNAYFASLNNEKQYVVVEAGQNYSPDLIFYLSFEGKQIFNLDKVNDKISWQLQDHLIQVNCKNILNAQIYPEQGVAIVISKENQFEKVLKGYAMDGTLLFVKHPPQGFDFSYLSTLKNQPSVVCEGDEDHTDVYGRSGWSFIIDTKTGDMTKGNLAY
ncbi:hypothetical protein MKX50_01365 [Paenibacillus sp. FSL W8-0186]|uniref:hypothetical protein n=1 Tax=Paenibacillus sp. FSL W8-0186 TaxID=2921709 RepID=UPI0030CD5D69